MGYHHSLILRDRCPHLHDWIDVDTVEALDLVRLDPVWTGHLRQDLDNPLRHASVTEGTPHGLLWKRYSAKVEGLELNSG